MNSVALSHFAIYHSPADFPGRFVVREIIHNQGLVMTTLIPLAVVDTIEEARDAVPQGLFCMPRARDDDPVIVETWV